MLCFSCSKPDSEGEYLLIEIDKGYIDIEITGNVDSKVFIINLDHSFNQKDFLQTIDLNYAIVYLLYNNCIDGDKLDFANETLIYLDLLVEVLHFEYGEDIDIFLLNKYLKANISLLYADVGVHKNKVDGVMVNNAFPDLESVANLSKTKIIEHTQQIVDEKESIDAVGMAIIDSLNSFTINDHNSAIDYFSFLEDNKYFNDYFDDVVAEICRPLLAYWYKEDFAYRDMQLRCQENFSINENIVNITIPVGLFWEEHELLVPYPVAEEIYNNLPTENKELYILKNFVFLFLKMKINSLPKA